MWNCCGSASLINVTFSKNHATYGGGMWNSGGNGSLTNVTFSENRRTSGRGLYLTTVMRPSRTANSYQTLQLVVTVVGRLHKRKVYT